MSDVVHIVPFFHESIEWVVPQTSNAFTFIYLRTTLVQSDTHEQVNHSISCVFVLKNNN